MKQAGMTFEEAKKLARKMAISQRATTYVYQSRNGKFRPSFVPPAKHIGTFTYPDEQWESKP